MVCQSFSVTKQCKERKKIMVNLSQTLKQKQKLKHKNVKGETWLYAMITSQNINEN